MDDIKRDLQEDEEDTSLMPLDGDEADDNSFQFLVDKSRGESGVSNSGGGGRNVNGDISGSSKGSDVDADGDGDSRVDNSNGDDRKAPASANAYAYRKEVVKDTEKHDLGNGISTGINAKGINEFEAVVKMIKAETKSRSNKHLRAGREEYVSAMQFNDDKTEVRPLTYTYYKAEEGDNSVMQLDDGNELGSLEQKK